MTLLRSKKATVATAALATTASLALWAASGSAQNRTAGPFNAAQVEAGRAAYAANCQGCHTDNLSGSGEAVPLAGRAFMAGFGGQDHQGSVRYRQDRDAAWRAGKSFR